jgi:hypothetical protein
MDEYEALKAEIEALKKEVFEKEINIRNRSLS